MPQSPADLQTSRGARYQPVVVATTAGKVLNGLVRTETDSYVKLIDAEAKIIRVPESEIDERRVGEVSPMPVGLVDAFCAADFAGLISDLERLKTAPASAR